MLRFLRAKMKFKNVLKNNLLKKVVSVAVPLWKRLRAPFWTTGNASSNLSANTTSFGNWQKPKQNGSNDNRVLCFFMIICWDLHKSIDLSIHSSFSPMHLTLYRLNQLSASAIFPRETISLSFFWTTFDSLTRIMHWVLGTANNQFLPL